MKNYTIRQIENLSQVEIKTLRYESQNEGFRFLHRLVKEYEVGTNKFDKPNEALYGVFDEKDELIAIGGINNDPYSMGDGIGRLRRFYVAKAHRRKGIGRMLVQRIIKHTNAYKVIVLHTDTEQGDKFYQSLGFKRDSRYIGSTHSLYLR